MEQYHNNKNGTAENALHLRDFLKKKKKILLLVFSLTYKLKEKICAGVFFLVQIGVTGLEFAPNDSESAET